MLRNPDTALPLPEPIPAGARGVLTLTEGQTNVLTLSASDLANLSEFKFGDAPSAQTPLIVNVTGNALVGNIANLPGATASASYILWNFPTATTIDVTGGDSIEGTIYAPNAALNWRPTQNVEGNIIAKSCVHGPMAFSGQPRELHDFPFAANVSCGPTEPGGTLTLVKHVDNTAGGAAAADDWTLTATGPGTVTGPGNSAAVTAVPVDAGNYHLSESGGPDDYTAGVWSCSGGAMGDATTVTVADGEDITCEITNTYVPAISPVPPTDPTGPTEPTEPTETTKPTQPTQPTIETDSPTTELSGTATTVSLTTTGRTTATTSALSGTGETTTTMTGAATAGGGPGSIGGGSAATEGELANTGAAIIPALFLSLGLAAAGIASLIIGRRRGRHSS